MKLSELKVHQRGVVVNHANLPLKAMEMGILNNAVVELIRKSPVSGMLIIKINNSMIALPIRLASEIEILPVDEKEVV